MGELIMTEKNRRKLEAKRSRGVWTCARPVTQVIPNKKKLSRQKLKRELQRRWDDMSYSPLIYS